MSARIVERLLGGVAGSVVFAIWAFIIHDLFSQAFSNENGLSGSEWILFSLGVVFFTLVMVLAGVYAVDATREDREDV